MQWRWLYHPEADAQQAEPAAAEPEPQADQQAEDGDSPSYDHIAAEIDRVADLYGIDPDERLTDTQPQKPAEPQQAPAAEQAPQPQPEQQEGGQQPQPQQQGLPADDEQLLRESGIDPALLPEQGRGLVAGAIRNWWENRYRPVAEQLQQYWQEFGGQLQAAAAMAQSREWEIAQKLVQNPALLQQVEGLLGQQPATAGQPQALPELPQINEEEMTPTEKALWQHTRAAWQQAQNLQQELASEREYVSQLEQWAQQMHQWATNFQSQMAETMVARTEDEASREFSKAIEQASREYGFNVLDDQERFNKAVEWIEARVRSLYERHLQSGGNGDFKVNYGDLMREALKAAGYDEIASKRRREASATAPPPMMREGGPQQAFRDEREIIDEVADKLGIE